MKAVIYPHPLRHAEPWLLAVRAGLGRHGWRVKLSEDMQPEPCDLAVFWGLGAWRAVAEYQRAHGDHYLIVERGYVGDRFTWTSLGLNGLNGCADFANKGAPGDRWAAHFADFLLPWRGASPNRYPLVIGQVPGDAAVAGVDLRGLYERFAAAFPGAVFRPHPVALERGQRIAVSMPILRGELDAALAGASFVCTHTSNVGVLAMLAGLPVIAARGSMAEPVSWPWEMMSPQTPPPDYEPPGREQWAHELAYCQWQLDEIESGQALDRLLAAVRLQRERAENGE